MRFDFPDKFSGGYICVYIHHLAGGALSETGDNRQDTAVYCVPDRLQVHPADIAYQSQFLTIKVITDEYSVLYTLGAYALLVECTHKPAVGPVDNRARHFHHPGCRDPQAPFLNRLDRSLFESDIKLRPSAVQYDGHQAQVTQKSQCGRQRFDLFLKHGAANFDHGKLQLAVAAVLLQVVAGLAAISQLAQYLAYNAADISHRCSPRGGRVHRPFPVAPVQPIHR